MLEEASTMMMIVIASHEMCHKKNKDFSKHSNLLNLACTALISHRHISITAIIIGAAVYITVDKAPPLTLSHLQIDAYIRRQSTATATATSATETTLAMVAMVPPLNSNSISNHISISKQMEASSRRTATLPDTT